MSHLVVVGHGSQRTPRAGRYTEALAEALRRKRALDAVHVAFLKQAPFLGDVLAGLADGAEIQVLPHFAAAGQMTRRVIPHALAERGRHLGAVSLYPPVGALPGLSCMIAARAGTLGRPAILVVGHGSGRGDTAAVAVRRLTAGLPDARAAFLDQAPHVAEWRDLIDHPRVLVVSLLAGWGRHASQDLPRALGLPGVSRLPALPIDPDDTGPFQVGRHRLWLFRPLCDAAAMVPLILALRPRGSVAA